MKERLQQVERMVDRWVLITATSTFIGTGAWFSDYIAQDIAETAFKYTSRYGKPHPGQGIVNFFLPPWVRGGVKRAVSAGQENFRMRQSANEAITRAFIEGNVLIVRR